MVCFDCIFQHYDFGRKKGFKMKIKVPVEFKGEILLDCPDRINNYNKKLLIKTFLENILVDLVLSEKEECPDSYLDQADYSEFPIKIPFIKKAYKNPASKDWEELNAKVSKSMWNFGNINIPKD